MMPRAGRRVRAGMTLLELVIALTVGALAVTAGVGALAMLADRRSALLADADHETRGLAARRQMERWLAEVRLPLGAPVAEFRGVQGTVRTTEGDVGDDDLTFTTSAPALPSGDFASIHLHVMRDADRRSESGRLVADVTPLRGTERAAPMRIVLAERVRGFSARYFTSAFGREEWLPSWASGTLLPGAVQLTVVGDVADSLPAALRVPITVPFANGR